MKRTRREIRKAITESANRIKSNIYLEKILEISEIFRKSLDDKECTELTDLQWKQRSAISNILDMKSARDVSCINSVINGMRGIDERRAKR